MIGSIGGFRNRLIAGANIHNGTIDTKQFVNLPGAVKGALARVHGRQVEERIGLCRELVSSSCRDVALVAGTQFLHAVRDRQDRFLSNGDQSGRRTYDICSPKVGVLWDVDPTWQVFANVSRSAEVPTFDANTFATPASSDRQRPDGDHLRDRHARPAARISHGTSRSIAPNIRNELQCLTNRRRSVLCTVSERGPHRASGRRGRPGRRVPQVDLRQRTIASGSTSPTPTTTSSSTATRLTATTACPACRRTTCVPKCSTSIRAASMPARTSSGCRRLTSPTTPISVTVDPYVLLNFRIGYDDARAGWSGYLEGRNLLDKRYIASTIIVETANAASALFNPGTGRAIYGGLRYPW